MPPTISVSIISTAIVSFLLFHPGCPTSLGMTAGGAATALLSALALYRLCLAGEENSYDFITLYVMMGAGLIASLGAIFQHISPPIATTRYQPGCYGMLAGILVAFLLGFRTVHRPGTKLDHEAVLVWIFYNILLFSQLSLYYKFTDTALSKTFAGFFIDALPSIIIAMLLLISASIPRLEEISSYWRLLLRFTLMNAALTVMNMITPDRWNNLFILAGGVASMLLAWPHLKGRKWLAEGPTLAVLILCYGFWGFMTASGKLAELVFKRFDSGWVLLVATFVLFGILLPHAALSISRRIRWREILLFKIKFQPGSRFSWRSAIHAMSGIAKVFSGLVCTLLIFSLLSVPMFNRFATEGLAFYCLPFNITEKLFTTMALNDYYLWADRMNWNIRSILSAKDAYNLLLKNCFREDRFSYLMTSEENRKEIQSASYTGLGAGYIKQDGVWFVRHVIPDSPAHKAGLCRGQRVLEVNGKKVAGDKPPSSLYKNAMTKPQIITCESNGSPFEARIQAGVVRYRKAEQSFITYGGHCVGYLRFDNFEEWNEPDIYRFMKESKKRNVDRIVLDLRENGGGKLSILSGLSEWLIGSRHKGVQYQQIVYPLKYERRNYSYSVPANMAYNGARRLAVITSASTCSASEGVINLTAPFLPVIKVGETTCGKPWGMSSVAAGRQELHIIGFMVLNRHGMPSPASGIRPDIRVKEDLSTTPGSMDDPLMKAALRAVSL